MTPDDLETLQRKTADAVMEAFKLASDALALLVKEQGELEGQLAALRVRRIKLVTFIRYEAAKHGVEMPDLPESFMPPATAIKTRRRVKPATKEEHA